MPFPIFNILKKVTGAPPYPTDGLFVYYPFNGNLNDAGPNGYNLNDVSVGSGSISYENDQNANANSAMRLNTTNGTNRGAASISFPAKNWTNYMTICFWQKVNSYPTFVGLLFQSDFWYYSFGRFVVPSYSAVIRGNNGSITDQKYPGVEPLGVWRHHIITFKTGNLLDYWRNNSVKYSNQPIPKPDQSTNILINGTTNACNTSLNDLFFYDRRLTSDERLQIYNLNN